MNHLLDHDLDREEDTPQADHEISLGPGTLLGIFFALAVFGGALFGLGYSMGRRAGANAAPAVIASSSSPALESSATKPSAGSSARPPVDTAEAQDAPSVSKASAPQEPRIVPVPASSPAERSGTPAARPAASASVPGPAASAPPASSPGVFMVQVAAVSTQEIADIELAALKKYNYPVVIRHEPTDQLLHIQIGPYSTRKDAEAMRQNVLSHGFNAIVK